MCSWLLQQEGDRSSEASQLSPGAGKGREHWWWLGAANLAADGIMAILQVRTGRTREADKSQVT